ncbi:hypothetical protein D3C71_1570580 [compost metagenome]
MHRLLDMFPLQAADRRHRIRRFDFLRLVASFIVFAQRAQDHLHRRRLGQIVIRTQLDRFHRSSDGGIAGDQQDAHVLPQFAQWLDQVEAGFAAQLEVDQRKRWR